MDNEHSDEEFFEFEPSEEVDMPTKEELAVWLSEYMSQSQNARNTYRSHFCNIAVNRIHEEFGIEGMCELMMAIDKRAGWISDIILEDNDIHDAMFKAYGVFDDAAILKARQSNQMTEMNKKIWRLRRKYAKLISDEIMNGTSSEGVSEESSS